MRPLQVAEGPAVRAVADSLLALSATVNEANAGLRQRLQLDGPEELPALEACSAAVAFSE